MKNFTYFRPTTAEQAVTLLEARWGNTELLAGGTDLLSLQKQYIAQPGRVVSLNGIAALQTIVVGQRSVSLGAGVTLATIAAHADLRRLFPALTMAAGEIGGPQIRNMGTLGGIADMPQIYVHMHDMPERGVIGIGEPPTIGTAAAVGNAVFNAIGVRVPNAPYTPERVLAALANRKAGGAQ